MYVSVSDQSSDNESTGDSIPFKKSKNTDNDSGAESGSDVEGDDV